MFYFYNLRDCRDANNKGRKLIKTLWRVYPDVFGHIEQEVETGIRGYNPDISGLLVKYDEDNIVCVAVMTDCKLDRIFTLPNYRNLGHAETLLKCLRLFAYLCGISFLSPVDPKIIPLFIKCGWKRRTQSRKNKDGTIDFVSDPNKFKDLMYAGGWLKYIKEVINRKHTSPMDQFMRKQEEV